MVTVDPTETGHADIVGRLVNAIHSGDVPALQRLIAQWPEVATARGHGGRTALHVATDWPGYFPNAPRIAALLIESGADPNARTDGPRPRETPLHWTASTDNLDVADVLIDAGADIEAPDGSIGTPLDNAIGYGCWHVARRLVDRGAAVDKLWHAAALGLLGHLDEGAATATQDEIDEAFWQACHGGQLRAAQFLLARGANIQARPGYADTPAIEVSAEPDTRRQQLVTWMGELGA
ncbi:MAG TPA: ankyrin repeat domain-containing protein [Micromonosporaceae bacterium]|jgi:ankyrin repeat protein